MLPFYPMTLYRPIKAEKTRRGTYSETLSSGTTVYGIIRVHEGSTEIVVDKDTDVRVEDQIVADGGTYRVTGDVVTLGSNLKSHPLDRTEKPIVPTVVDESEES